MSPPVMEVTLVKAAGPGDRDRAWLTAGGVTRRGPVHVVHDLPHLAVESLFGIGDGLWAELDAGDHAAAGQAAAARDPERQKQGRIVSGAAAGVPASIWLTPGHRRAKTITNCVANRWGDGPDTPARVDDQTISLAIRGVRALDQRWLAVPPGGKLSLCWPLAPDFFAGPGPAG